MVDTYTLIPQVAAIVVGVIGSITDIKTGKIYNSLTLPAALVGIVLCAVVGYMSAPDQAVPTAIAKAISSVIGWFMALAIMLILQLGLRLRLIGGGDTKLLAALGTFIGPGLLLGAFLYFCIVYSVWTCGAMMFAFPWNQLPVAYTAKDMAILDMKHFNEVRKSAIPMAPFITAGLIVAVVLQEATLKFMGVTVK
jgi:Flp pilus assembly protein protease CpaA